MQPVTSHPQNPQASPVLMPKQESPLREVTSLMHAAPKILPHISGSLAGRAVFTIEDIEVQEPRAPANNDNAQKARSPQETLDNVKELAGETASLKQHLRTLKATSGQALEDKKSINSNFERYLEQYSVLLETAHQLSQETFKAERTLARRISKGANWQAPLTEIAKRHLRLIGTNTKAVDVQEAYYQEQKTESTTALADLHSNWNALCTNLEEVYSLLCWLKALQSKPADVEKERFYAEFLYHHPIHSGISYPDLQSMQERTALLGRLERSLGKMVKLHAKAVSLANSASLNPEKNAKKIETHYFVVAAKFGRFVLESFVPILNEVPSHLQNLEEKICQSKCAPLKPKAWNSLSHYPCLDVTAIKRAEQQHQQNQNDWNTELKQIQSTWQSIYSTLESTREKINKVAKVLNRHLKTSYEPIHSPLPQEVESTDDHADDLDDLCLQNAENLLKGIEASIEIGKGHYSSWSKPTADQVDLLRTSYTQHYNNFRKVSDSIKSIIEEWQEDLERTEQEIEQHTLPPMPEALESYLQAFGKLEGQEEKYISRFEKIQEKSLKHAQQLTTLLQEKKEAQSMLERLEKLQKNLSERLCRLAEGYDTGYLTWQRVNSFQGNTYSVPPEPSILNAKFGPNPTVAE